MNHPLQCQCGTLRGSVAKTLIVNRGVCYCRDCQAFAYFLGRQADVLDERGGTDIIQTLPRNIAFTHGIKSIACMRLTPKGMIRWFAGCCGTPIGNTLASPAISFIGLVHTCLETPDIPLQASFGPVRTWVNTASARGTAKPSAKALSASSFRLIYHALKARIDGNYKHNPLFRPDTKAPIVTPRVLSSSELASLMQAVATASAQARVNGVAE